jgi:hypothetical protein
VREEGQKDSVKEIYEEKGERRKKETKKRKKRKKKREHRKEVRTHFSVFCDVGTQTICYAAKKNAVFKLLPSFLPSHLSKPSHLDQTKPQPNPR